MRNIKIYSTLGSFIDVGTARVLPNTPTVIQEDQLTPQGMQQYGDYIATASMDNVIEHLGANVNLTFLMGSFGWVSSAPKKEVDIANESIEKEDAGGEGNVPESSEPTDGKGVEASPEDSVPSAEESPKDEEPAKGGDDSEPSVTEVTEEPPADKPVVGPEYDPFEEKPSAKKAAKKSSKKKKASKKKKKS